MKTRRVGVAVAMSFGFGRATLRGVGQFGASRGGWAIEIVPTQAEPRLLRAMRLDGMIVQANSLRVVARIRRLGLPAVNVSHLLPVSPMPSVWCDDAAVGRLAARHLLERGFRRFAFVGYATHGYSLDRHAGFLEVITGQGTSAQGVAGCMLSGPLHTHERQLGAMLRRAGKPLGVFAANDAIARLLAQVCVSMDLGVPEDVAILGVDDDDVYCAISSPPLSSVAVPAQQIGFRAAALLDRLMDGRRPPGAPVLLAPSHVVTRQSTDVLAISDGEVASAIRFVRQNLERRIGVGDLAQAVAVNRRVLERRFVRALGRTPLQEIRRARLANGKFLLATTDLTMPEVALRCGFPDAARFATVFRQIEGKTPSAFRRLSRTGG